MQPIAILTGFYNTSSQDPRIGATHISLFLALLYRWSMSDYKNPVAFSSSDLMKCAKIESRTTYHKCLRDLKEGGYIIYIPSYNPFLKSLAYLKDLSELT